MGEDAEGAAESVSKLRAQMLALTGVDIQLDESTYKSTYQILLEISKVWGDLNDISRASVLEQLFGKRQANIGAAILENGELLQQVYETAEDSAGSAMREQEEYAKSIQYSLDSLKASYQSLAQTIMDSDFLKGLVDTGSTLLQVLEKVIDKIGLLPPLLATIMTFKGKNVLFGTMLDEADKTTKHLTLMNQQIGAGDTRGLKGIVSALKSVKLQAIGAEIAATALNAALTLGVSVAITKLTSVISDWVNAEKNAAQEAEEFRKKQAELREEGLKNAETYEKEKNELNSILSQYLELASSTKDAADVKKSLSSLQDQLIDKYGKEAGGIDLVNKSLKDNIDLMLQKQELDNRQWQRENVDAIQAAKDYFGIKNYNDVVQGRTLALGANAGEDKDAAITEGRILVDTALEYIKKKYPEIVDEIYLSVTEGLEDKVFLSSFVDTSSIDEQKKAIDSIVEAYEYALSQRTNVSEYFKSLSELYSKQEEYDVAYNLIKNLQEINTEERELNEFNKNQEVVEKYEQLLEKLSQLNAQYNNASLTVAERYGASLELDNTVSQLKAIATEYPVVSDTIEAALDNIGLSFNGVTETVETAKEIWLKSLDEAQKGVLKDVDGITKAMTTLASGEGIDSKSAWEIINLDDSKILSNIRVENGKYIFDLNQIVALKDKIINQEIETRKESIASSRASIAEKQQEILLLENEIEKLRIRRDAMIKSGINSADDERRLKALDSELAKLEPQLASDKTTMDALNYSIRNESLYVQELTGRLGDLSETADMLKATLEKLKKEVSDLEKEAEDRLKAQTVAVDNIIKKHESELKSLEKEKEVLDKQLDSLKEQETEIQNIIQNYETVSDVVRDEVQKQIDAIEKERKAVEDAYNERIDKLKSENEEREDALEYEEKLAKLNNAKNNKVLTYDSARGWTYGVNKDALKEAENDLASFENEQAIKTLEKERDEALKGFDGRVEELESYANQWQEVIDSITKSENELITVEILGADWRDKITTKDTKILNTFKTEYTRYNTQLKNNVRTEIENLEKSIEAKDKEISAKQEQIKVWQDYKTEIQETADAIKASTESYLKYLGDIKLNEGSTTAERIKNLQSFSTAYKGIINEISSKNGLIDQTQTKIDNLSKSLGSLTGGNGTGLNGLSNIGSMAGALAGVTQGLVGSNSVFKDILDQIKDINKKLTVKEVGNKIGESLRDSVQNVNQFFGFGSSNMPKPKTDLTVGTPDISKLYSGVYNMPAPPTNMQAKPSGSTTFNIQHMDINGVQNPTEFAKQFEQNINRYWSTKLTESKVK